MYCTAPLSPRKGRFISFHDDNDDDDDRKLGPQSGQFSTMKSFATKILSSRLPRP